MKRRDLLKRILTELSKHPSGEKIKSGQIEVIARTYDLEKKGLSVSLYLGGEAKIDRCIRKVPNMALYFKVNNYSLARSSDYDRKTISQKLKEVGISTQEIKMLEEEKIWYFTKEKICGFFLGDDIPF